GSKGVGKLGTDCWRRPNGNVFILLPRKRVSTTALPSNNRIDPVKRYDSIGSAPAHRPRAEPKRFGPGHFRLGRLNEAVGVWGRRGPLLEFESIFRSEEHTSELQSLTN